MDLEIDREEGEELRSDDDELAMISSISMMPSSTGVFCRNSTVEKLLVIPKNFEKRAVREDLCLSSGGAFDDEKLLFDSSSAAPNITSLIVSTVCIEDEVPGRAGDSNRGAGPQLRSVSSKTSSVFSENNTLLPLSISLFPFVLKTFPIALPNVVFFTIVAFV